MGEGSGPSRRTVLKGTGVTGLAGLVSGCSGIDILGNSDPEGPGDVRIAVDPSLFVVTVDGERIDGWQSVTLPNRSVEEGEYGEERTQAETTVWGPTTYGDLAMERGVKPADDRIWRWQTAAVEGRVEEGRKEVTIQLTDETDQPLVAWQFSRAWVKEYSPPELDASADGDVATESITVAYDRMQREEV